jgi:hypothetical protein
LITCSRGDVISVLGYNSVDVYRDIDHLVNNHGDALVAKFGVSDAGTCWE